MNQSTFPILPLLYLAGQKTPGTPHDLYNPTDHSLLARVPWASLPQIEAAIAAAVASFPLLRRQSAYQRYEILSHLHRRLTARQEDFAQLIATEAAKPIRTARAEVARALTTFRLAAEESTRIAGEQLPVDIDSRSAEGGGYHAIIERFPLGPCTFITPFNFPLNLVAHKVAPAIAAGCPFLLKPSERTPLTALLLGDLLAETALLPASWSILPCGPAESQLLVTDPRIKLVSFTGSPEVGWKIKTLAGKKPVLLELGNNSAVILEPDADLADALPRIVAAAFSYAGQSCISVQRIFLHASIADSATARLIEQTRHLKVGLPLDEATDLGPLIDEAAALRLEAWINDALAHGAILLTGGHRQGSYFEPTLLANVDPTLPISCREAFGPVAILERYADFQDALRRVNHSPFGLQAGLFTHDLLKARQAFLTLNVAALILNDTPTTRLDNMPYGGLTGSDSGLGREGVKYAIQHFTEPKLLLTRYP